jgi:hypothetical protein
MSQTSSSHCEVASNILLHPPRLNKSQSTSTLDDVRISYSGDLLVNETFLDSRMQDIDLAEDDLEDLLK